MDVIGSAPGKVFVVGEYAVVDGGPAVVATVTRRLAARVRAQRGRGEVAVRIGSETVRRPLATERVDDVPPAARFVTAAALVSARLFGVTATDLEITTASELDPGADKTGLGGSAAVTAATVSALHAIARGQAGDGALDEHARVAAGVYAHRLAQGGGSAADVVAATAGGLVWIEGLDGGDVPLDVASCAARAARADLRWERLALPAPLALEVVASGRSCATGPRVARYRAAAAGADAATLRAWGAGMRAAAEAFRTGCHGGDRGLVLRALRAAAALLARLGAIAALPVFTAELRRACALAATLPATAAKPSGAGGGDCAIALTAEPSRLALRERWREAGLFPLAVDLEPRGARCEVPS